MTTRTTHLRRLVGPASLAAWVVAAVAAGQQSVAPAPATAAAAREAERQDRVSDDLTRITDDFGALLDDLRSNQVFAEAAGDTLESIATSIGDADELHVQVAAAELRRASLAPESSRPSLDAARGEIEATVDQLGGLLAKFNALRAADRIAATLEDIIDRQKALAAESAELGRAMLAGQPPTADPAQLAERQAALAEKMSALERLMEEVLAEDLLPEFREKLVRAAEFAEQDNIRSRLGAASESLREEDVVPAVGDQEEALAALEAMEEMLNAAERLDSMAEDSAAEEDSRRQQLESLLEEQKALREQVEKMEPAEFDLQALDAQLAQMNLEEKLPEMTGTEMSPPTGAKSTNKGEGGSGGMGKKATPGVGPGGPRGGPALAMQKAAAALGEQQQQQSLQAMMEAEAALAEALDSMGEGKGQGKGKGRGQGKGKGKSKGGRGTSPNQGQEAEFTPEAVAGTAPEKDRATIDRLAPQDARAVNENFARELPQEYREMLRAYFEFLSAE